METESESIDISSIKSAALRPLESGPSQGLQQDVSAINHLKAKRDAFKLCKNPVEEEHTGTTFEPAQHVTELDSLAHLASTVPDSQSIAQAELRIQAVPTAQVPYVVKAMQKMSSQGASPHDTQPLSQSIYENIRTRNKSVAQVELNGHNSNAADVTQFTLNEGDEGHIDLLSSYKPNDWAKDGANSDVDGSSPPQTQTRLPEFPESQRFKTPATAGKKRNYSGDFIETPALPRNPLARNGVPTSGKIMGLSQAFAATQAASSPFLNSLPHLLPSDLPSPDIELRARPTTAPSSSPLLEFHRSSNEPSAKYVPVKQSQADRELRAQLEPSDLEDPEEGSDDGFDSVPSVILRQRWQRERELAAQQQLKAASSPTRPRFSKVKNHVSSSPVKPRLSSPRTSPPAYGRRTRGLFPPVLADEKTSSPQPIVEPRDSEEETDHETESEIAVKRSSQAPALIDEDKENAPYEPLRIPETTARLQQAVNSFVMEATSPSDRHASGSSRMIVEPQSRAEGDIFAIADSQSSQPNRGALFRSTAKLISSGEGTDFVPQSQPLLTEATASALRLESLRTELSTEDVARQGRRSGPAPAPFSDTIPETSSARLRKASNTNSSGPHSSSLENGSRMAHSLRSQTQFDTAPSRQPGTTSNNLKSPPKSMPTLSTPPRGSKRKSMAEILAQTSPERSSSQAVKEMMADLEDPDLRELLGSQSPLRPGRQGKRRRLGSEATTDNPRLAIVLNAQSPSHLLEVESLHPEQDQGSELEPKAVARTAEVRKSPTRDRSIAKSVPTLPNLLVKSSTTNSTSKRMPSRASRSVWDLQASPEAKKTTQPRTTSKKAELSAPYLVKENDEPVGTSNATRPQARKSQTKPFERDDSEKQASPAPPISTRSKAARSQSLEAAAPEKETFPAPVSSSRSKAVKLPERSVETEGPGSIASSAPMTTAASEMNRSIPVGDVIAPNRIWACFNGKSRAYYPARCLGISGSDILRYQVQWEGYAPDELDARGVRRLELRVGDVVKVNLKGFPKFSHTIRGFKDKLDSADLEEVVTDIRGYKTLQVAPKQRKSLPANLDLDALIEVPVAAVYLDSNMWGQMKDRTFEYAAPALPSTQSGFATPMERPSTPSTPSSRSRRNATSVPLAPAPDSSGIFSGMAFAISYDDLARRLSLASLVRANGGLLLSEGFHEMLQPDSMELKAQSARIGFTALLADRHSRKEKYMQALALDLPCISGKWIEACIAKQNVVEWQPYLLPAGESLMLEGAIRSRTMANTNAETARLSDMLASRPNIFDGADVIVVMGRGKAEEKRKPYLFLTQALGAGRIERVGDEKAAKALLKEHEFSWVLVVDRDVEITKTTLLTSGKAKAGLRIVGNEFIVQSLILGKLYEE